MTKLFVPVLFLVAFGTLQLPSSHLLEAATNEIRTHYPEQFPEQDVSELVVLLHSDVADSTCEFIKDSIRRYIYRPIDNLVKINALLDSSTSTLFCVLNRLMFLHTVAEFQLFDKNTNQQIFDLSLEALQKIETKMVLDDADYLILLTPLNIKDIDYDNYDYDELHHRLSQLDMSLREFDNLYDQLRIAHLWGKRTPKGKDEYLRIFSRSRHDRARKIERIEDYYRRDALTDSLIGRVNIYLSYLEDDDVLFDESVQTMLANYRDAVDQLKEIKDGIHFKGNSTPEEEKNLYLKIEQLLGKLE